MKRKKGSSSPVCHPGLGCWMVLSSWFSCCCSESEGVDGGTARALQKFLPCWSPFLKEICKLRSDKSQKSCLSSVFARGCHPQVAQQHLRFGG